MNSPSVKIVNLFTIVLLLSFLSCTEPQKMETTESKLGKFEWLLGKWKEESTRTNHFEFWEVVNDSLFQGKAFKIDNGDSTFTESLKLSYNQGDVFYIADVPHNLFPVSFKFTKTCNNKYHFVNSHHDYPQKIIYHLITTDLLRVRIEGMNDKHLEKKDLFFSRCVEKKDD